jgi:hypothetical protein
MTGALTESACQSRWETEARRVGSPRGPAGAPVHSNLAAICERRTAGEENEAAATQRILSAYSYLFLRDSEHFFLTRMNTRDATSESVADLSQWPGLTERTRRPANRRRCHSCFYLSLEKAFLTTSRLSVGYCHMYLYEKKPCQKWTRLVRLDRAS